MKTAKQVVTDKLFEAIGELRLRSKDDKLPEVQRIFGVVLGLRMALIAINKNEGVEPYSFAGHLGITQLLRDNFGQKTLKEIRAYAFPEF